MPTAQSSSSNKNQADSSKSLKTATKNIQKQPVQEIETEPTSNAMSSNTGIKTPSEQPEFIKQALIIIEKKVRNLDKRRIKLEEYKEFQRKGQILNEDQLLAVSKYEEVLKSLELSRELEKQFVGLANDAMKQQKKQAKKEQMEREELVRDKFKEAQRILSVLDTFAEDSIRNDFLNETNGAFKLSAEELEMLDEFNKLVEPTLPGTKLDLASSEYADHLVNLIEGKNKPITALSAVTPVSYADLRKLFDRLLAATYWTQIKEQQQAEPTTAEAENAEQLVNDLNEQTSEMTEQTNLIAAVENLELNNQQVEQFSSQQQIEQGIYNHQNTSDDFIIVNSNECSEIMSKSPSLQPTENINADVNQQQQPQQTKTFFTTLNQSEQRNINEFINNCENDNEGINFLQDSEIQSRQQEHVPDELNYETQATQQSQTINAFISNDQKDGQSQYKQRGNRDYNGRPYQPRRYPDDRRATGSIQQPRTNNTAYNNGGAPPREQRNGGGGSAQHYNGAPRQNGGSYRGSNNGNNTNSNRGGYYRGSNQNQNGGGGSRPNQNNNQRGNYNNSQNRGNMGQEMHEQMA